MINPSEIIDSLLDLLQHIPDLVDELGGDESRIYAYHNRYAGNVSLEYAKYKMLHPSIMIAWQGTGHGSRGGFGAWRHDFSICLRAKEDLQQSPTGYYTLYKLITKGIPTNGDGQPMIYTQVHASCDPMDEIPAIQRQMDSAGVDFFEISMSFTEIGDD